LPPDAFERAFLAHDAQQFHLRARVDLRHFIEDKRAATGLSNLPMAPFVGACECAFPCPNKFALGEAAAKARRNVQPRISLCTPT